MDRETLMVRRKRKKKKEKENQKERNRRKKRDYGQRDAAANKITVTRERSFEGYSGEGSGVGEGDGHSAAWVAARVSKENVSPDQPRSSPLASAFDATAEIFTTFDLVFRRDSLAL